MDRIGLLLLTLKRQLACLFLPVLKTGLLRLYLDLAYVYVEQLKEPMTSSLSDFPL